MESLARKILLDRCEYYIKRTKELNEYIFNSSINVSRMEDELKSIIISEKKFRDKVYNINPNLIRDSGGGYDDLDVYFCYVKVTPTIETLSLMGFDRELNGLKRVRELERNIKNSKMSIKCKKQELKELSEITNEVIFNSWLFACRELMPSSDFSIGLYGTPKTFIPVRTVCFVERFELLNDGEYNIELMKYFMFVLDEAFRTTF